MTDIAALEKQRAELMACVAASETQLSILSSQNDTAFGAVAAEVAALVRNQRKLGKIEEQLATLTLDQRFSLAA